VLRQPAQAQGPGTPGVDYYFGALPCAHFFEIYVADGAGTVAYNWIAEQYPVRPGQPALPPCPRQTQQLARGAGLLVAFSIPGLPPGSMMIHAARFGGLGPAAAMLMQVVSAP
jgi:hypothetical protein